MLKYGELLKLCRQIAGLKQADLEARTFVSQGQISAYETGKAIPRIDIFSDLIEACGYEIGVREKRDSYTVEEMMKFMEENR